MTDVLSIVRCAIPEASEGLADHILWGRTPAPCIPLTAKILYHAASRWKRAEQHGLTLCECCDRLAVTDRSLCAPCAAALERVNFGEHDGQEEN